MLLHADHNTSNNDKLKVSNKEGYKRLATYFYLVSSNQNKYRNILVNLSSYKSLKNDFCPKMVIDGCILLSKHKMAREFKKNNKNKSLKKDINEENSTLSFAQVKLKG